MCVPSRARACEWRREGTTTTQHKNGRLNGRLSAGKQPRRIVVHKKNVSLILLGARLSRWVYVHTYAHLVSVPQHGDPPRLLAHQLPEGLVAELGLNHDTVEDIQNHRGCLLVGGAVPETGEAVEVQQNQFAVEIQQPNRDARGTQGRQATSRVRVATGSRKGLTFTPGDRRGSMVQRPPRRARTLSAKQWRSRREPVVFLSHGAMWRRRRAKKESYT